MRKSHKLAAVMLGALLVSGAAPAFAAEITASTPGATATTLSNRAQVQARDTSADNFRADADYKRGNASATAQRVSATAGNGSTATSPSGTTIATIRACTRNSNPLTGDSCSVWKTL